MRPLESRRSAHIGEFMADGMAELSPKIGTRWRREVDLKPRDPLEKMGAISSEFGALFSSKTSVLRRFTRQGFGFFLGV